MSTDQEALLAEARDPETPFERLVELVKHHEVEVRRALLANPNLCPTDDQGQLDTSLLKALASEFPEEVANLPLFVLHALIEPNEDMVWVAIEVVERTEDMRLIERLWTHWGTSWGLVREPMAKNPSTPVDILRTLGNEQTEFSWVVRQGVAENPKAPVDTLRTLANPATDSNPYVRQAAQKALADRGLT